MFLLLEIVVETNVDVVQIVQILKVLLLWAHCNKQIEHKKRKMDNLIVSAGSQIWKYSIVP